METKEGGYVYGILGLLSFISGLFLLAAYFILKGMRKHPGMLILGQSLAQTIVDFQWSFFSFRYWTQSEVPGSIFCSVNGIITLYFFFVSWNYSLCLSHEVLIKINNPMDSSYRKRSPIYHIATHSIGLIIAILVISLDSAGESVIGICLIKKGSWVNNIMFIPLFTYYPFSIVVSIMSIYIITKTTSESFKTFLIKHSVFLIVYTVFWLPVCLDLILQEDLLSEKNLWFNQTAMVFGCSSGLAINTVRLTDPVFIRYIKKRLGFSNKMSRRNTVAKLIGDHRDSGVSLADESLLTRESIYESDYTQIFSAMFDEAVINSIISLKLVLSSENRYEDIEEEMILPWSDDYYQQSVEWTFDGNDFQNEEISPSLKTYLASFKCKVKEYAPMVFKDLRSLEGLSETELCLSFDIMRNLPYIRKNSGNKGGRSSAFFYFSFDKKYLVKTITKAEQKVLLEVLLPEYHAHIKQNPDSLIARLFGLFAISFNNTKCNLIIMQNILPSYNMQAVFDLKGSKVARQTISHVSVKSIDDILNDRIYKDLDFLHLKKSIFLSYEDGLALKKRIHSDVQLFTRLNIMDYSLLLGISYQEVAVKNSFRAIGNDKGKGYVIGIIDFLQTYGRLKRLETLSKSFVMPGVSKLDISAVGSEDYGERFVKFICSIIYEENNHQCQEIFKPDV
ncbi:unnamed protein product [Blepharisma stoltei]|uniref:PIPK domain-containing protein n=1 Tax=Blepharisma stoltei TaxID=1481888 RepID=A0AAU9JT24_9CILI|nr:unnamed protein product [Blepharisma stoltei]